MHMQQRRSSPLLRTCALEFFASQWFRVETASLTANVFSHRELFAVSGAISSLQWQPNGVSSVESVLPQGKSLCSDLYAYEIFGPSAWLVAFGEWICAFPSKNNL